MAMSKSNKNTAAASSYQTQITSGSQDEAWDGFLAKTSGGHHVQTSLWAQVKALLGWRAARVVVTRGEQIVAGAQLLIRPLALGRAIGYVPKGPLFASGDPVLARLVIEELHRAAEAHRVQYLVIQPPNNGEAFGRQLPRWGFRPSSIEVVPTATVRVDLTKDLDEILAQMKSKTRYNVRLGQRKGITVREGTQRDLSVFYRLLVATGQRQQFSPESEEFYFKMWRVLSLHGYIKLFLTEYDGEAVSGLLAVPFGDTVIYKRGAWSGRHGNRRPNEVMHWTAIQWAKTQGYHYYDFEGIAPKAARAILEDRPLSDSLRQTTTRFKLQFGGQVTLFPGAYDYIHNPLLRWAYGAVFPKVQNWPVVEKLANRLRTA